MAVFEAAFLESKVGSNVLEWYPHIMREKTGGKTKIAVRAIIDIISMVPSRPISRNQFCRSRGRSHNYIYLYRTRRRTARMARPANARTDTQMGGRTRRSTDADADARTQTQKHGRRRRSTDADTSARWRTDAKYSCVQCVGGKIVQTQDRRRRKRPMAHGR